MEKMDARMTREADEGCEDEDFDGAESMDCADFFLSMNKPGLE